MIDEFTDEKKKEREPKDAFIKKEMVVLSRNSESSYTCPSELVSRLFREFLTCFWRNNPHIVEDQKGFWP